MYVYDVVLREPICVKPELGLMEMLGIFQQGQCHIALISNDPVATLDSLRQGTCPTTVGIVLGLVTMEDVLEKIIQSEIMDETDSNHSTSIYPHGGAPTIFYHQPHKYSHRGSSNRMKRKTKDRTPYRGSVVTSQHSTDKGDVESDSEYDGPKDSQYYYQSGQPRKHLEVNYALVPV